MKLRALVLSALVMITCYAGLTLLPALFDEIGKDVPMTREDLFILSALYAAGVFASYLVGCIPRVSASARRVVLLATFVVSSSMASTVLASNVFEIAVLRFVQGFASMVVPVFSTLLTSGYGDRVPLALGILFAATFVGGAVGYLAHPLSMVIGWRGAFIVYAALVAVAGAAWIRFCNASTPLPRVSFAQTRRLWQDPFTLLWGLSFFTAMWILFTVATLGQAIAPKPGNPELFGEALQLSMALWSVAGGALACALSRKRVVVVSVGRVQQLCLALSALGAVLAMSSRSPWETLLAAVLLGAVQGASPAFWSLPGLSYPKEEAALAGFVLGALSNAAAVVGPFASSFLAMGVGLGALWASLSAVSFAGIALTSMAMRIAPPITIHPRYRAKRSV